jgi:hypothetical protein
MEVEKSQRHLDQPVDDQILREILALGVLDFGVNITAIAVDHNDIQILFPIDVRVFIRYDICVSDFLQESDFLFSIFQVFLTHVSGLHTFDNVMLILTGVAGLIDLAKGATADGLNNFINVHALY